MSSAATALVEPISQILPTPFLGQHVGLAIFDINHDGAPDILFAAGRHWVDQSYALINLGQIFNSEGDFEGMRFSSALPSARRVVTIRSMRHQHHLITQHKLWCY